MKLLPIIMSLFPLAGVIMFYLTLEEHKTINHLLQTGVEVDAVAVELVPVEGGDDGVRYSFRITRSESCGLSVLKSNDAKGRNEGRKEPQRV
jgi:hypothetical protein